MADLPIVDNTAEVRICALAAVAPGDTLIVGITADTGWEDETFNDLRNCLPGVKIVVIAGATSMAVYKPGDTSEPVQITEASAQDVSDAAPIVTRGSTIRITERD